MNPFSFVVDDVDQPREHLAELGVTRQFEPEYAPGRRLYGFDSDGVEIELVESPA